MKNNLVVILGAGFSRPAGLPLAKDIRERFDRDQRGKLLHFSSSEWMWKDNKPDVDIHNGTINSESTVYAYIINEVIEKYKLEHGSFDNYELFYQWIHDVMPNPEIKNEIYENAKSKLLIDFPQLNDFVPEYEGDTHPFLFRFKNDSSLKNVSEIINYLIADLLRINDSRFYSCLHEYEEFFQFISSYDIVDIFTLNHDLLLENLFKKSGIPYSRGFTKEHSEIQYQDEGTPIAVFKNAFDKSIKIHKLHGSLDFYRFEHFVQKDNVYLEPTGEYNYFTTTNYREKHYAIMVNPTTGETLQDHNFDIVPKFITGTDKEKIIDNDIMYSVLFERFKKCMTETKNLLISGYSYGDEHINIELKSRDDFKIINQNPFTDYPFSAYQVTNIKSLKELGE